MRRYPLLAGFGLAALLQTTAFVGGVPDGLQPIAFNHAKHVGAGLSCTDCHTGARAAERATLPELSDCMSCHENALTESAEEARLRKLQELTWRPVTRTPAHVYFSHRRHTALGGLDCAVCHGAMEKLTAPPERPLRPITMDGCIGCHRQKQVRSDCNDCHR
jgi:hypothetical protein